MFLKKNRLKPYPMKRFKKTVTDEGIAKEGYVAEGRLVPGCEAVKVLTHSYPLREEAR